MRIRPRAGDQEHLTVHREADMSASIRYAARHPALPTCHPLLHQALRSPATASLLHHAACLLAGQPSAIAPMATSAAHGLPTSVSRIGLAGSDWLQLQPYGLLFAL